MSIFQRAMTELNVPQLVTVKMLAKHKLVAIMMPRQVGKTHVNVWMVREVMRQNSNAQCAFLMKDYPSIMRATREKFAKLFDPNEFKISSINGITHHNISQEANRGACFLTGVDKSPDKIRGGTMAYVGWSEVAFAKFETGTNFEDMQQQIILPMVSRTRGMIMMESTPNGSNFWRTFWENPGGFKCIRFGLDFCIDTGALSRETVDFMQANMHPDVFKQEMECEFVAFTGRIYSEFSELNRENIPPPEPHEYVVVGVDIGFSGSNSAAIFGVWRDGILCVFDQIYVAGHRHDELAHLIDQRMQFHKVRKENYSCYTDVDEELLEEMNTRGMKVTYADKLDTFACRLSIKEALYLKKILVSPIHCKELIAEVLQATWSEKKIDDMEYSGDPNNGHYDSEAAFRYLWRGAKLERERPESVPEHAKEDPNSAMIWKERKEARKLIREREKHGTMPNEFEY